MLDTRMLQLMKITSTGPMFMKYQIRRTGHIFSSKDVRMPKHVMYDELAQGKRHQC